MANELLSRCSALKSLYLSNHARRSRRTPDYSINFLRMPNQDQRIGYHISSIPSVNLLLAQRQSLEILSLNIHLFCSFFEKDVSKIVSFKLKHLKIESYGLSEDIPEYIEQNFLTFLAKQSHNLERLDIHACRPNVIERIFNKMLALQYLRILGYFRAEDMRLSLNENIVELIIPGIKTIDGLRNIIRHVPNLKKLFTRDLTVKKFEIIAKNLPALRTLMFLISSIPRNDPLWISVWKHANPRKYIRDPNHGLVWSIEK